METTEMNRHSFHSVGSSAASPLDIMTINLDYLSILLSKKSPDVIRAKSLLTQIAIGNSQIFELSKISKNQNDTNLRLEMLNKSACLIQESVVAVIEKNYIELQDNFKEIIEGVSNITSKMSFGFESLTSELNSMTDSICDELSYIQAQLTETNLILVNIESILRNRRATDVQEFLRQTDSLIVEAMLSSGKNRAENLKDALTVNKDARRSSIGSTNPTIAFQNGFILWQLYKNDLMEETKISKIKEASYCFERAARLYTNNNISCFDMSLRHAAHMMYLVHDYLKAEQLLISIDDSLRSCDSNLDLARVKVKLNKSDEALELIKKCFLQKPLMMITIFSDKEFEIIFPRLISAVLNTRTEVTDKVLSLYEDAVNKLKNTNFLGECSISSCLGSLKANRLLSDLSSKILICKNNDEACSLDVIDLVNNYNKIINELKISSSLNFENKFWYDVDVINILKIIPERSYYRIKYNQVEKNALIFLMLMVIYRRKEEILNLFEKFLEVEPISNNSCLRNSSILLITEDEYLASLFSEMNEFSRIKFCKYLPMLFNIIVGDKNKFATSQFNNPETIEAFNWHRNCLSRNYHIGDPGLRDYDKYNVRESCRYYLHKVSSLDEIG